MSFFKNILTRALMVFHLATGDRKSCFVKGLLFFTDTAQFTSAILVEVRFNCVKAVI